MKGILMRSANPISHLFLPAILVFASPLVIAEVEKPATVEQPTAGGVLRLSHNWYLCRDESGVTASKPNADLSVLIRHSDGPISLPALRNSQQYRRDVTLWRTFSVPNEWQDGPVWMLIDPKAFFLSKAKRATLNGKPLDISPIRNMDLHKIPRITKKCYEFPEESYRWLVDIGPLLRKGSLNVLAFSLGEWPIENTVGVWLYHAPAVEPVLFLVSPDMRKSDQAIIRKIAKRVEALFPVKSHVVVHSEQNAGKMRCFLQRYHQEHKIGGAVLLGSHPLPKVQHAYKDMSVYLQPRYYEDLDAEYFDTDNDGIPDQSKESGEYGIEIWTSYVRSIPQRPEYMQTYLKKVLYYLSGEMPYVHDQSIDEVINARCDGCGLDDYDKLMRPAMYMHTSAHAGVFSNCGPHQAVPIKEAIVSYPGSLIVRNDGCSAGMILDKMKVTEAYLFGRCNTILVFASGRTEVGKSLYRLAGLKKPFFEAIPHMGVFYNALTSISGRSWRWNYHGTSQVMLGMPFVSWGTNLAAPSGRVYGKVVPEKSTDSTVGFFVSIHDKTGCCGRIRTDAGGEYELTGFPPGRYTVRLHLNPFESIDRKVRVKGELRHDFNVPAMWQITGQVMNAEGRPEKKSWVEISLLPFDTEFKAHDLFAPKTDENGRFAVRGLSPRSLFLRGCGEIRLHSPVRSVTVKPKQHVNNISFTLQRQGEGRPPKISLAESFPNGVTLQFGKHTYRIITEQVTRENAIRICKSRGGYLAVISNDEELTFLFQFMKETWKSDYWISSSPSRKVVRIGKRGRLLKNAPKGIKLPFVIEWDHTSIRRTERDAPVRKSCAHL